MTVSGPPILSADEVPGWRRPHVECAGSQRVRGATGHPAGAERDGEAGEAVGVAVGGGTREALPVVSPLRTWLLFVSLLSPAIHSPPHFSLFSASLCPTSLFPSSLAPLFFFLSLRPIV